MYGNNRNAQYDKKRFNLDWEEAADFLFLKKKSMILLNFIENSESVQASLRSTRVSQAPASVGFRWPRPSSWELAGAQPSRGVAGVCL